jgi:hypothetical protein
MQLQLAALLVCSPDQEIEQRKSADLEREKEFV